MVGSEGICAAMKQLYTEMDKTSESVTPLVMLKVLHMTFPRFAERGEGGVFQQQVNTGMLLACYWHITGMLECNLQFYCDQYALLNVTAQCIHDGLLYNTCCTL